MKKTILIPTDFSVTSLQWVEHALNHAENQPVEIVLTHCQFLPDSISELLFFSKKEIIHSLRSPEFNKAFRTLRKHHIGQVLFRTDLFTGLTQAAFNHFIEGNQIDEAVIPKHYQLTSIHKRSFCPIPYIRKSQLKVIEV